MKPVEYDLMLTEIKNSKNLKKLAVVRRATNAGVSFRKTINKKSVLGRRLPAYMKRYNAAIRLTGVRKVVFSKIKKQLLRAERIGILRKLSYLQRRHPRVGRGLSYHQSKIAFLSLTFVRFASNKSRKGLTQLNYCRKLRSARLQKRFLRKLGKYSKSRRSPFQNLEKISFFRLFGYIRKRRHYAKGKKYNLRSRSRGKFSITRHDMQQRRRRRNSRQSSNKQSSKKLKNLVLKNKTWCIKIKKSDGRVIYRPLKLSDFLSSRSGWRTRTSSFKKPIPKSGRSMMLIRGTVRARNEYDISLFRKRKIYSYYKRIYKFMGWKFSHYRSVFKKYALSRYKYTTFRNIQNQFAWGSLATRSIQLKASNLKDSFKNSAKYLLIANSVFLWKLNQFNFVNGAFPLSFYSEMRSDRRAGNNFQSRPFIYSWNKKYRLVYSRNTKVAEIFPKVIGVRAIPLMAYKNSSLFAWYKPRFNSLLSNRQRHFIR